MLAYVEDKGWCIIQNITAYNKGPERQTSELPFDIDSHFAVLQNSDLPYGS